MHSHRARAPRGRPMAAGRGLRAPGPRHLRSQPGRLRSPHLQRLPTPMASSLKRAGGCAPGPSLRCPRHHPGGSEMRCQLPNFANGQRRRHKKRCQPYALEQPPPQEPQRGKTASCENDQARYKQNIRPGLPFPPPTAFHLMCCRDAG